MMKTLQLLTIFILVVLFLLPSCVSKKRYLEELSNLQNNYESQISTLDSNLLVSTEARRSLELDLAEKRGANNALTAMQDKLQGKIDQLEKEIEKLNEAATNKEQSLDVTIQQKNREIAAKQKQLDDILALMDKREAQLNQVFELLKDTLKSFDSTEYTINRKKDAISIELTEEMTFTRGATARLLNEGTDALEKISAVMINYPALSILVIGHTDNRPVPRNSITSNWDYGALRASTVVKTLIKEFVLRPNQVTVASKGEFAPRTSNETREGQEQNRRIELLIEAPLSDMERDIRRIIK